MNDKRIVKQILVQTLILVLALAQANRLVFEFLHYHSFLSPLNIQLQNADKCI